MELLHHPNLHVIEPHHLPRVDLAGLAQFLLPIHGHGATGNNQFALAAAVAQSGEFQKLIKFDVFAVEFKVDVFHVNAAKGRQ
jgi:hypothetical protein